MSVRSLLVICIISHAILILVSSFPRMTKEREELAAQVLKDAAMGNKKNIKKRKRNPDPLVGEQGRRFELIDSVNLRRHHVRAVPLSWSLSSNVRLEQGWTLDTTTSTPLFSLICRPLHPLPVLPKAAPTSWTREATKSKASKAARAILRAGGGIVPVLRVSRSRRVRIDVRKWGRKKLIFKDGLLNAGHDIKAKGTWECVEEAQATKGDKVKWIFRTKDGSVKRTEMVQLTARSVPHTDSFAALLTAIDSAGQATSTLPLDATLPLKDYCDATPATLRARSLSPPRYTALPTRSLIYNEEDTFAFLIATQDDHEVIQARDKERDSQLEILRSLMGDEMISSDPRARDTTKLESDDDDYDDDYDDDDDMDKIFSSVLNKKPLVEGFNDEEDDAEEVMRLRGGGDATTSAGTQDESSEEDSSDEDEGDDAKAGEKLEGNTMTMKPKTTLQMGSLKDMFKPQESSGMSHPFQKYLVEAWLTCWLRTTNCVRMMKVSSRFSVASPILWTSLELPLPNHRIPLCLPSLRTPRIITTLPFVRTMFMLRRSSFHPAHSGVQGVDEIEDGLGTQSAGHSLRSLVGVLN